MLLAFVILGVLVAIAVAAIGGIRGRRSYRVARVLLVVAGVVVAYFVLGVAVLAIWSLFGKPPNL